MTSIFKVDKFVISYIFIVLLLLSACIYFGFYLNNSDGIAHYNYSKIGCNGVYPNIDCITNFFGDLTQTQFWAFWFILLISVPLIFWALTKNTMILPGFFLFTGLFFAFQSMQTYAQLFAMIWFIIIIFTKPSYIKLVLMGILLSLDLLNIFRIHNMFQYILMFSMVIEFIFIIKLKYAAAAFLVLPNIQEQVYDKIPSVSNLGYFIIYYGYHFLVEYMLFIFSIPGLIELYRSKNWRHIIYFVFIIGTAIFFWWQDSFNVWRVTRTLLMFPIILLPYFIIYLKKSPSRNWFWAAGIIYFCLNLGYFIIKGVN